jgi:hypothetical protein
MLPGDEIETSDYENWRTENQDERNYLADSNETSSS